jgi:DNA-binding NtrC family response regulator
LSRRFGTGKLREDLYDRLNVFPIALPPLREHAPDVPLLAELFLAAVCERENVRKRFTPAAQETLAVYRWPGKVRELRNAVRRTFVMAEGEQITHDLQRMLGARHVSQLQDNAVPNGTIKTI